MMQLHKTQTPTTTLPREHTAAGPQAPSRTTPGSCWHKRGFCDFPQDPLCCAHRCPDLWAPCPSDPGGALLRSATHCRLSYVREKRYNKTKRAAARRAASPAATGSPPTRPPASSSTDHPPAHRHLAAYPPETASPEPAWQSSRYAVQPARPSFAPARSSWPVTPARRRRHGSVGTNGVCGTNLVLWLTRWVIREDRWYGRLVPPWSMMTAGGADARLVGAPSRAVASAVGVDGRLGPGDSR